MKKYENPEINISLFDSIVATSGSARDLAKIMLDRDANLNSPAASSDWADGNVWNVTF